MGALGGRRVVVTGAARGLGASAARALAAEGAECILLDRLPEELWEAAPTPLSLACDLGERTSCLEAAAFAKEAAAGDLTALIHCAGVLHLAPVEETADAAWDETMAVNLTSAFFLVRALLPELCASGGGSVVLTSSRAGVTGFAGESAYCASKFGVEGFTKALAAELAEAGVSSNTLTPGARIKPTGMTTSEEASLPTEARPWDSADPLGPAFPALALLRGAPTGRRFRADQVAKGVRRRGLPLPVAAWEGLGG